MQRDHDSRCSILNDTSKEDSVLIGNHGSLFSANVKRFESPSARIPFLIAPLRCQWRLNCFGCQPERVSSRTLKTWRFFNKKTRMRTRSLIQRADKRLHRKVGHKEGLQNAIRIINTRIVSMIPKNIVDCFLAVLLD